MTDNIREPNAILSELSRLQDVINTNEEAIEQYPSDFGLLLNYNSLKSRENQLFDELIDLYAKKNIQTFDITLSGSGVTKHRISMALLGKISTTFQDVITTIAVVQNRYENAESKTPTEIKAIENKIIVGSQLNVTATAPGSFRVIITSNQPLVSESQVSESYVIKSLDRFNKLVKSRYDKDALKQQIKELGPEVIVKYKKFLDAIHKTNTNFVIYDKIIPDGFETETISADLAEKIINVISVVEIEPDQVKEYRGILKGISLLTNTFEFQTTDGDIFKGKFDEKISPTVRDYFDKIAIAKIQIKINRFELTDEEKKPKYHLLELHSL